MALIDDRTTLILASLALVFALLCLFLLKTKLSGIKRRLPEIDKISQDLESLKTTQKQHAELLNELKMVTQGMSQKLLSLESVLPEDMARESELRQLKQQVEALDAKLQALEAQDPTARLYTKANKLVASGASIEDIMQECDLPRAEAELVMSLHARK